jgi:hypothetical protein
VGSLHFPDIAFRSSFVYLSLPPLCFSAARRRCSALAMCAAPAAQAPLCAHACATPAAALSLPAPALASPRSATSPAVCPSCTSPSQHLPHHLLPSDVPRITPLLCRRPPDSMLACPCVLHVAELLPERRRDCHAHRWDASSCLHAITSSSGPRALPLAPLVHVLAFAHFLSIQFPLPRSPLFTGPPPPSLLTVGSPHHRPPSSIRSAINTPTIHRSSPSDPIPISSTRTARPQHRRAPFLRRRSASRRPTDTGLLRPDQQHHQHHIILLKRSCHPFSALHCPSL